MYLKYTLDHTMDWDVIEANHLQNNQKRVTPFTHCPRRGIGLLMGWDFCWKIFNLLHSIMESFRWNYNAFFMSAIAGLSTGLGMKIQFLLTMQRYIKKTGGLFVILYGKPDQFKLGHLLSFSAGVMIYISFMDLLPEASEKVGFVKANLSVCILDFNALSRKITL